MDLNLKDSYDKYLSKGFTLQKAVKNKKFSNVKGSYSKRVNEPFDNLATGYVAIIPKGLIIVDNDNYQDGGESMKAFISDLGSTPEPFALTPSGGEHYAFANAYPEKVIGNISKKYPSLDIYAGYQSVIPIVGTKVLNKQGDFDTYKWSDFDEEFIVNKWSENILEILELRDRSDFTKEEDSDLTLAIKEQDMSFNEAETCLKAIKTNLEYDEWLEVGMALFDLFPFQERGLTLFDEFSQRSANKYDKEFTRKKWDSGALKADKITYKRLRAFANTSFIEEIEGRIEKAENFDEILEDLKAKKSLNSLNGIDKDIRLNLATKINAKMKEKKLPVIQARTLVKQMQPEQEKEEIDEGDLNFLDNLVYVESLSKPYYFIDTKERFGSEAATGKISEDLKTLKEKMGLKSMTVKTLLNMNMIKICSNHEYNPKSNKVVFSNKSGGNVLNTFVAASRPPIAEEFSERGLYLISKFEEHLKYLITEDEAKTLIQWLAFQAQNFGTKVLWTPLIQSIEGLGKSLIGNAMINNVFGQANSGTVDSNVVVSPQTSWATTGVFKVLEEIKLAGHNRFEVLNQLKPFITNNTVSRVEKYEASSEVPNYCNFLALTNFKDAIPVSADDRRWWVVFSKLNSIEELEELSGENRRDYFQPLHDLANGECGDEFHKWLMEVDLTGFSHSFPPTSIHKARMIATEESKTSNLSDLKELIALGSRGVIKDIVSSKELRKLTQGGEWEHDALEIDEITKLLRGLGYNRFPKKVRWKNETHGIWFAKSGLSDKEIRTMFKESMELPLLDGFEEL
jgi:hypothetical protein